MACGGGATRTVGGGGTAAAGARGVPRAGRDERALAENAPVADPGAGHEDRAVADLAEVSDGGPDDLRAVAEDGALPEPYRVLRGTDHDAVLQDRGVVADGDRLVVRADHGALGDDRAGTDVDVAQQPGRAGDLGLWLVGEQPVEAHGGYLAFRGRGGRTSRRAGRR